MKMKFNSDDDLPLNEAIEIDNSTILLGMFFMKQQMLSASFLRWMPIWIINNIKVLYHHRIYVFEGIDVSNRSASFHYWYFLNTDFKFQPNVLQ